MFIEESWLKGSQGLLVHFFLTASDLIIIS